MNYWNMDNKYLINKKALNFISYKIEKYKE